jgi:proteasome lid subunit RPN8/RPN11
MLSLEIPRDILIAMIEQAKAEAPLEACGILAGREQRVERWYKMTNRDRSGEHFMMAPAEQFKVARAIRASGLQMLAVYHSHPQTPARPSDEDIRLALTPNVVHVIVSLQDPDRPTVKGYEIEGGRVAEISVRVVDTTWQRV